VVPESLKKKVKPTDNEKKEHVIDLTNLNVVYKNDEKKIEALLKGYQVQVPEQIAELERLAKERNYKSLKTIAKSLKTKINYLGIKQMYNYIDSIIKLIDEDKNLTAIPGLSKSIKTAWAVAEAELTDILNNKA
jgi:HPt (histidine-containing phosphotransfer) domain-containing protein